MSATVAAVIAILGIALIYWAGNGLGLFVPSTGTKS